MERMKFLRRRARPEWARLPILTAGVSRSRLQQGYDDGRKDEEASGDPEADQ